MVRSPSSRKRQAGLVPKPLHPANEIIDAEFTEIGDQPALPDHRPIEIQKKLE